MIDISSILVLIGMFGLRIGVPIAVIAVLVYALKRLDRQWEQEARAQRQAEAVASPQAATAERAEAGAAAATTTAATPAKVRQPVVIGYDMPGMQPPPGPAARPLPGVVPAAGKPCWESKHCSADKAKNCAAVQHPEMACWQARLVTEGHMPEACPTCEVFQRYPLP